MADRQHFVFLLVPDFTHLAFACAIEPLRIANLMSGQELYSWSLASQDGGSEIASNGISVVTDRGLSTSEDADRIFVVSGNNVARHCQRPILDYLRRQQRHGIPLGGICSGAYVLARAGLLDEMACAVHWAFHDCFAEEFPSVRLRHTVFVADEAIITASGGPAAADLMLHLVARDHGAPLARQIADQMVYSDVRQDSSQQRTSIGARLGHRNPLLTKAFQLMEVNMEEPLSTDVLAGEVGVTPRQLQRLFRRFVGASPHRAYVELRLQKARSLLRQTNLSVMEIALACGFHSASNFSRTYRQAFGRSPKEECVL